MRGLYSVAQHHVLCHTGRHAPIRSPTHINGLVVDRTVNIRRVTLTLRHLMEAAQSLVCISLTGNNLSINTVKALHPHEDDSCTILHDSE